MWARIGNPEHRLIVWNLATSKPHSEVGEVSGWFWDPFNVGGAIGMRNLVELR